MKNLQNMHSRLNLRGGAAQQDRMIKDKVESLRRAVQYSYQGAKIQLLGSDSIVPALMNPNKLLADYDEKTVSVEYKYGFKTGDVFRWINPSINNNETYWLIYLQDLTELAYFKADVRRCDYQINWLNNDGENKTTYATIIGPKEQKIRTVAKSQFMLDIPNYTIALLLPKNNDTLSYFQRYTSFYLQDLGQDVPPMRWQVEAIDAFSLPGVLEVYAREYYINEDTDNVEEGIVNGLVKPALEQEQIQEENKEIVGDNFIKPGFVYSYEYTGSNTDHWSFDETLPIQATYEDKKITIKWDAPYSGNFVLSYGTSIKTIIVESLF